MGDDWENDFDLPRVKIREAWDEEEIPEERPPPSSKKAGSTTVHKETDKVSLREIVLLMGRYLI
jgi:hypothetical protein